MSRLPLYAYVVYKAYKYKNALVLVSANWLLVAGFSAAIGGLANAFVDQKIIVNLFGFMFAISFYMVALTAKEIKQIKKGNEDGKNK